MLLTAKVTFSPGPRKLIFITGNGGRIFSHFHHVLLNSHPRVALGMSPYDLRRQKSDLCSMQNMEEVTNNSASGLGRRKFSQQPFSFCSQPTVKVGNGAKCTANSIVHFSLKNCRPLDVKPVYCFAVFCFLKFCSQGLHIGGLALLPSFFKLYV